MSSRAASGPDAVAASAVGGGAGQPVVLELRPAGELDQEAVAALAAGRAASMPPAPQLLALVDGRLAAAISLRDGTLVTGPLGGGAAAELLRARAEQLEDARRGRRLRWPRRRLVAPCS